MGDSIRSGYSSDRAGLHLFEELFCRYYPRLKRYATHFLKDDDEAEDLVQDVFFQLWHERDKWKKDKNIASFVFVQTRNRCLNKLKRKLVEKQYLDEQAFLVSEELYSISLNESGEFVSMKEQLSCELAKLIAEMPEKCARAFSLKWLEGKKIREIAEIMGISTTMVDKHLARGLEIVREKMTPDLFLLFICYRYSGSVSHNDWD